jgi:NAD(P)-dependent dehydrogenase (short-subunit alcohol dehydrogenase family)
MSSRGRSETRYDGASRAALSGILDLFHKRERVGSVQARDLIDGKTCLVTGANRGLGKAVAIELARRGGHVVMACRSGHPHAAEEVKASSGSDLVEIASVDLADSRSIEAFVAAMKTAGISLDIVVLNAGVVPGRSRKTAQGFEEMFAVDYLANFLLLQRLLANGTIPVGPASPEGASAQAAPAPIPRLVFVTSESHRSAPPIDLERLGDFREYGMKGAMTEYARNKLLLSTFAVELSRRLQVEGRPSAAVHQFCPGPVNSGIAREAPAWSRPLVKVIFSLFFRSPRKAAEPAVFLCCSRAIEGRTGIYLHLMTEKSPSARATDEAAGRRLWQESERLLSAIPADDQAAGNM